MQVLIFSRDRALQLDATLHSFLLHCEDVSQADVKIIYTTTTSVHARQYEQLQRDYAGRGPITFVREEKFRTDTLNAAIPDRVSRVARGLFRFANCLGPRFGRVAALGKAAVANHFVLFLVDDNLFVRDFRLRTICDALTVHEDALGFSLRLGTNTTYCYSRDREQRLPKFSFLDSGILKFPWNTGQADFGYPLEVSSSVYRLADVLPFLSRLQFRNPNTLEEVMAHRTQRFRASKPFLLCYETSVTFCNPINIVQTVLSNRSGAEPEHSSESLAEMFSRNFRVDVHAYSGFVPNGCHQEVALHLRSAQKT